MRNRCAALIAALWVAINAEITLGQAMPKAQGTELAALDRTELLKHVIDGIQSNYEPIKTVQGDLVETDVDSRVKEPTTTTFDLPNGGKVTITQIPIRTMRASFTIKGGNVLYESLLRQNEQWVPQQSIIRRKDRWIFWDAVEKSSTSRLTEEMPSISPFDPRDMGPHDVKLGLLGELRRRRVVDVIAREPMLRVTTELNDDHSGSQSVYCFDPNRHFLPVSIVGRGKDGLVYNMTEYSYDEVIPGKCWFLSGMKQRYFAGNRTTDETSDDWTQQLTIKVVGHVWINEEVDDRVFLDDFPRNNDVRLK
jgi:hypothetical protein